MHVTIPIIGFSCFSSYISQKCSSTKRTITKKKVFLCVRSALLGIPNLILNMQTTKRKTDFTCHKYTVCE